jgi:D-alanine-D-alanine ligase
MQGGPSAEREVSLRSGSAVVSALRRLGHEVSVLDPIEEGWRLEEGTDLVFLALHGTYGEDGSVQSRLEELGMAYTGCGPEASRVAFDKVETKRRCGLAGVLTPRHLVVRDATGWPAGWEPPLVLKPVRQGSSVGLGFVNERSEWPGALAEALQFDREVLVEERILGRELTVGILEDVALPLVEVRPDRGEYDYHHKYTAGATVYECPARLEPGVTGAVQAAGLGAFRAVGGRDYGRVDVILDDAGGAWVLEVNTLPGMTETSLLPKAASAAGLAFETLCQRMVDMAVRRIGEVRVC